MKRKMIVEFLVLLIAALLSCGVDGAPKTECDRSNCDKANLAKFYAELNCKPVFNDDDCCPVKYDCSKFSLRSIDKCHYQGEVYELRSQVSSNKTVPHCLAACGCYANEEKAYFNCAQIECAELFHGPLRDPKCFRQYSQETCCSVNTYCFNETTEEETKKIHQCEYKGRKYYKGQKFYPHGECKICICDEGYDGSTNEPWCREFQCNVELLQGKRIDEGCVPVFYKSGCCPVDWRCPAENDSVVQGPNHKTHELFCNFGSLKLYQQDKLSDGSSDSECTCITPPFLTCNLKPRPEET